MPLVLALLTPVEVLVPVLVVTLGYRGLVVTYAVEPSVTMPVRAASPVARAFSLAAWTSLSLLAASGLTGIE